MAIKSDTKYQGTVAGGSALIQTQSGTLAFQVMLECEDGEASYPIWLTKKNHDRAMQALELLGADMTKLGDANYLEYELGVAITGNEVSFWTKTEEYKGKSSIKVAGIGKKTDPNIAQAAAEFFGGASAPPPVDITDDDIPF